jgi:hypothetical protein
MTAPRVRTVKHCNKFFLITCSLLSSFPAAGLGFRFESENSKFIADSQPAAFPDFFGFIRDRDGGSRMASRPSYGLGTLLLRGSGGGGGVEVTGGGADNCCWTKGGGV